LTIKPELFKFKIILLGENMSKASKFLSTVSKQEEIDSLQALAQTMKESGDDRLSQELETGAKKGVNERGLIILALGLKKNGDDRLWKELDLQTRIKESVELQNTIEALENEEKPFSDSKAGKFLSEIANSTVAEGSLEKAFASAGKDPKAMLAAYRKLKGENGGNKDVQAVDKFLNAKGVKTSAGDYE